MVGWRRQQAMQQLVFRTCTESECLHAFKIFGIALTLTSDGFVTVSHSHDDTLEVWKLLNGKRMARLKGPRFYVSDVALSWDSRLAVAAEGSGLYLWDVESSQELARLHEHTWHVKAVVVARFERYVVSASLDNTLRVWNLENVRRLGAKGKREPASEFIMPEGAS